jgi:hypothetical protein
MKNTISIYRLKSTGAIKAAYYNKKGNYHNLDSHTIEYIDGEKEWRINGKRHRDGKPAVENVLWYQNGKLHRENGPAVEYLESKGKEWYLFGEYISGVYTSDRHGKNKELIEKFYYRTTKHEKYSINL